MSDNLKIRRPLDAQRINLTQAWEVEYWTRTLDVTELRLRVAVKTVGTYVVDVKNFLRK